MQTNIWCQIFTDHQKNMFAELDKFITEFSYFRTSGILETATNMDFNHYF